MQQPYKGTYRWDLDSTLGRAMIRFMSKLLELVFPRINLKVTDGDWVITVATDTNITSPTIHVKGDVFIEGNVYVDGEITATGDVVAGGISLMHHTHPGCSGGTTGQPM